MWKYIFYLLIIFPFVEVVENKKKIQAKRRNLALVSGRTDCESLSGNVPILAPAELQDVTKM